MIQTYGKISNGYIVAVLFTTNNPTICKYLRKFSIEVVVGDVGRCGIPELSAGYAVLITGYGWNKEIAGSNKTRVWMVLIDITYLEAVLNWTKGATRMTGCHECTEKLTSEGLGRSADRNGPIPHVILVVFQINTGSRPVPFRSRRMGRSRARFGTIHATWPTDDVAKNV
jgi:hypothetical protein